jgi:hypothetical protein
MCGATTLLAHFHLAINGGAPFRIGLNGKLSDFPASAALSDRELNFVMDSAALVERISECPLLLVARYPWDLRLTSFCRARTSVERPTRPQGLRRRLLLDLADI